MGNYIALPRTLAYTSHFPVLLHAASRYKLASCVMTNALHTFMYYCVTDSISVKIYGR